MHPSICLTMDDRYINDEMFHKVRKNGVIVGYMCVGEQKLINEMKMEKDT
jgi:uncharacterized protein YuzE